jgi:protein-tyrosine phosphatase
MTPERLRAVRARAGAEEGVFDDGADLLVRVPDQFFTRRVLERSGGPVVVGALGETRLATTAALAERALGNPDSVDLIIDAGPTPYNRRSALLRLEPGGGVTVVREGAIDERTIRKRLVRHLLFVCTGNTCRSPMAAAITRHLLAAHPDGVETVVRSAGVSAGFGMAMTAEAADALTAMGIEPGRHASAPLSREMLNEAEAIFAMTRGHLESVIRLDPAATDRALLLDPAGGDIPDPIGSPRPVYDQTANVLRDAIETRLKEIP